MGCPRRDRRIRRLGLPIRILRRVGGLERIGGGGGGGGWGRRLWMGWLGRGGLGGVGGGVLVGSWLRCAVLRCCEGEKRVNENRMF